MLLARKVLNAAELLWDSLDERERTVVVYAAAWTIVTALLALHQRQRERLKQELLQELTGAR